MTTLISRLLGPGLVGAEIWDTGQPVALHPREEVHVARAAQKRRRDFALGRACARMALAQIGRGNAVIAKGADGAPLWPAGISGSITHTDGYAAAMVGEDFSGIGIDAEQVGGVTRELWPRLFSPAEVGWLERHSEPLLAATVFFSTKEASYKAWALKGALGFQDIDVVLEEDGLVARRAGAHIRGRYAVENGVVLVAVWAGR